MRLVTCELAFQFSEVSRNCIGSQNTTGILISAPGVSNRALVSDVVMINWTLGFDADIKDHGFVANPSGDPRDTRRGEEVEIPGLKRPRRQIECRGLCVYVRSVVHMYHRTLGRTACGYSEILRKRGAPPGLSDLCNPENGKGRHISEQISRNEEEGL